MTDLKLLVVSLQSVVILGQFTNDEIEQQYNGCADEINLSDDERQRLNKVTLKHRITLAEQELFRKAKPHERQTIIDKRNKAAEIDKREALREKFYPFEKCMMTLSETVVGKD